MLPIFLSIFPPTGVHTCMVTFCFRVTVLTEPEATLDALFMNGAIMKVGVATDSSYQGKGLTVFIFWATKFEST